MIARYDKHYEGKVERPTRTQNILEWGTGGWVGVNVCMCDYFGFRSWRELLRGNGIG